VKIPFVDLKAQYKSIQSNIDTAIESVITETAFIGGKYVQQFEEAFASMYGVQHCISCANGTDSLYIIMKMLGIGIGDEVITVTNSWISSSETISQTGATPVFIDIDENFYSLNEQKIEAAITSKTKAIIPVHLQGQMCNMDAVMAIAKKHNIPVIEDCAQSHFSEFNNQLAGTFGVAASFSFYPGKNLGAYGDAGCIITNNSQLATQCKMYARHGALIKHQHQIEGINSRLDGLQAAILTAKLPFILEWTNKRIENAKLYNKYLKGISQVQVPVVRENTKHTFHLYVMRCKNRNALAQFLKEKNIETAIHYPTPLHEMEAYKYLGYQPSDFPVAHQYKNEILSLPLYPELSEEQIQYIAEQIHDFYSL
jgi:dTDP-4-amino-4,6-dideoxygalactose transaminase